jgi:restriction endonuclease S subunit
MENFMKEMWNGSFETSISYSEQKLFYDQWKEFRIGDYFKVVRGKRIVKNVDYLLEKYEEYYYPVITASASNNSVSGYYHSYNCEANSIVCCGEVNGFYSTYQEEKCWVLDTNRIFIPKKNTGLKLNKFIALFLITILKKEMFKFSYGRKARPDHIINTIIKLPSTKDGKPDWQFMENYIRNLQFSDTL